MQRRHIDNARGTVWLRNRSGGGGLCGSFFLESRERWGAVAWATDRGPALGYEDFVGSLALQVSNGMMIVIPTLEFSITAWEGVAAMGGDQLFDSLAHLVGLLPRGD